jgi:hypothetical protein
MEAFETYGFWILFHEDNCEELENLFAAGGTIEKMNLIESKGYHFLKDPFRGDIVLLCVEENAEECFKVIVREMTAPPSDKTWLQVFRHGFSDMLELFLERGFYPPITLWTTSVSLSDQEFVSPVCHLAKEVVSRHFCQKAVVEVLCFERKHCQPLSSIWHIIATKIWSTRNDPQWTDCLSQTVSEKKRFTRKNASFFP